MREEVNLFKSVKNVLFYVWYILIWIILIASPFAGIADILDVIRY